MLKRLVTEIRDLIAPERQKAIRDRLRERLKANKADEELAALRKQLRALETDAAKWRNRLMDVSPDMIGEVEDAIRECRQRQTAVQEAIDRAEASDPSRDLETALADATKEIWTMEQALAEDDRLKLREAIHGIIDHVIVTPGERDASKPRTARAPAGFEIVLRKGAGLALLSDLDPSRRTSAQEGYVAFSVSA